MDRWNIGVPDLGSITPVLHHSTIPVSATPAISFVVEIVNHL